MRSPEQPATSSESSGLGGADGPLGRFNMERDEIVAAVRERVVGRYVAQSGPTDNSSSLEYVLNEVAFCEIRRYEKASSRKARRSLARWRDLALRLGRMSVSEKRGELSGLVAHYVSDVVGNFNPSVYRFTKGIVPPALSVLFAPILSVRDGLAALGNMETQIHVRGPIPRIKDACQRGTVIFAPTHSSNLDSLVLGLGFSRAGLPAVTYGAGKNLFTNPLISYFMYNLGAYRVDRRLRFSLYKEVLKEYSTVLIERGYHSLFFPGGTRARSNRIEQRLKLGLLGTGLAAFQNRMAAGDQRFRVFVVPVTINYRLVLEAETLIEDFLADEGKSRYIIEDDEFSRLGRVIEFLRKLMAHESAVILSFGPPMDPFGNETNESHESIDQCGRVIDPGSYMRDSANAIQRDAQRDVVYTRSLGDALGRAYRRDSVFLSTTIVCRALFDHVAEKAGVSDIYRLLRLPADDQSATRPELCHRIGAVRDLVTHHPEAGQLSEWVRTHSDEEVLDDALGVLGTYHTRPVAFAVEDRVQVGSFKLLHYYANRLAHLGSEQ